MSEGENMFAFQICDIANVDKKICHVEFLGCIAEDVEEEEEEEEEHMETTVMEENEEYNKRGIDDVTMYNVDDAAVQDVKRPRAL